MIDKRKIKLVLSIVLLSGIFLPGISEAYAQRIDSVQTIKKPHNPKTASLLSMALPGLGQAYNRKFIKIPVIYAALGTTAYFVYQNNRYYNEFKTAYKYRTDSDPNTNDKYTNYSPDNLLQLKDYYRRNLELSIIIATGIYVLNIIDASVDAHLFDFDVSDDLSISMQPLVFPIQGKSFYAGINLSFSMKN